MSDLQIAAPELFQNSENDEQTPDFVNGHTDPIRGDFLSNELIDEVDCNNDCIYKNSELNDDAKNVIFGNKTETNGKKDFDDCDIDVNKKLSTANEFESICLKSDSAKSDINHNGDVKSEDVDSDTECTEPSESKSENTVCDVSAPIDVERSVETSTETLVSENVVCR